MKKYAQIINGVVQSIIHLKNDDDITALYHPDFINTLAACGNDVQESWLYNGKTFTSPIVSIPDLAIIQQSLKQRIDQDAEKERLKYITDGVGQSMTYQEKVNQAASYSGQYTAHLADPKNNPKPNDAEYLLLASGLGIDGDTLLEVAGTVTYAYAQWQSVGAEIEKIRLQAKAAIDETKTVEAAQAVYDGIQWP